MAKLVIFSPEGQQERDLFPVNTLGRHPANSIQLLDRIVSKEHCVVEIRGTRWMLRDLGSLNGTFINDQKVVGEAPLNHGDQISLGNTRAVFHEPLGSFGGAATAMPPERLQANNPPGNASNNPFGNPPQGNPPQGNPPQGNNPPAGMVSNVRTAALVVNPVSVPGQVRNVTVGGVMMESHVRTKIAAELQQFLPEREVHDVDALRRDYEKLRISYELQRTIGAELDLDRLLEKLLDRSFDLLSADRGVVLLYEEEDLKPRCSRAKKQGPEELVISRAVVGLVVKEKVAVLSSDAKVDPRFSESKSIIMTGIRSSMAVPLLHKGQLVGVMMVDSQNPNAFGEKELQLFTNIANQAALSIVNAALAKRIEIEALARARFQRLLSPAIAELVVSGKVEVKQGGEPRTTTMLFTDIRGFTSKSEAMRAEDTVAMLNDYFERMVEIIFRHEGTLDKFVGDEIMALFGAPVSHPDDAVRSVRTSLEMLNELRVFNTEREAAGKPGFQIGIGINTGEVVAGYIGSSKAMQYTVIGAPVNLASRLCAHALGMQILISETTLRAVQHRFEVRELAPVQPKGIAQPVRVFEVLRDLEADERPTPVEGP